MTDEQTAKPDSGTGEQPTATLTEAPPTVHEPENNHKFHPAVSPLLIVTEGGDGFCEGDTCTLPKGK